MSVIERTGNSHKNHPFHGPSRTEIIRRTQTHNKIISHWESWRKKREDHITQNTSWLEIWTQKTPNLYNTNTAQYCGCLSCDIDTICNEWFQFIALLRISIALHWLGCSVYLPHSWMCKALSCAFLVDIYRFYAWETRHSCTHDWYFHSNVEVPNKSAADTAWSRMKSVCRENFEHIIEAFNEVSIHGDAIILSIPAKNALLQRIHQYPFT